MAYNLASNANNQQITSAVNYLLANFNGTLSANQVTGAVNGPGNVVLSYLYQYMDVKYAQSYDGSIGFSSSPTNATYYGLRNTNSTTESTNYTDYIWYDTIGFGTTNFLWYTVSGGRQIKFYVGPTAPTPYYAQVPNGVPINLDILSGINTANVTIYQWAASTPANPTTTSTYTWATGVLSSVPSGWSATIPSGTLANPILYSITVTLVSNNTQATSTVNWTSAPVASTSTIGSDGSSTFVVYRTADDGSPPTNAEVNSVIGRNPVAGDNCTLNYNAGNLSELYIYNGTSWSLGSTYITGNLIVGNSITAANINSNGLIIRDNSGNAILGVGNNLASSYINPAPGWLNSNVSINANGTLSGAGSGQVTASGISALATNAASALSATVSISATTGAGFRAGSLTWDSSGNVTGGYGVAMTPGGIVGVSPSSVTTFSLNAVTGAANFAGTLQVGSSPTISGTTMTGTGAVINTNGTFALGTASQNMTYNGSTIKLNGFVSATTSYQASYSIPSTGGNAVAFTSSSANPGQALVTIYGNLLVQGNCKTIPTTINTTFYGYASGVASASTQLTQTISLAPSLTNITNSTYSINMPISVSFLVTFSSSGSYNIGLNIGSIAFRDSSSNLITPSSFIAQVSYNSVLYQPLLS